MIQRVQSLFLLGAVILCVILMYVPIYELVPLNDSMTLAAGQAANTKFTIFNSAILAIMNGAIGVLALISIFMYKNRNLQIRATNLALLINCGLIGLLFFSADSMSTTFQSKVHYLYGSYLPVIIAIFLFLAIRFIKRDDALVRSADSLLVTPLLAPSLAGGDTLGSRSLSPVVGPVPAVLAGRGAIALN
ncbi:MAG: DUF4293 domain-containing protein [Bacteroidetes bacterium]|nr:DUF4293 domain-containing protein [Bacteroidota bacterium]